MATPITIKKRKMTFKPSIGAAQDDAPTGDETLEAGIESEQTDAAPDFNAPSFPVQGAGPSGKVNAVFGILAIIAALIFTVIILIQWVEWSGIVTSFPRPIQTGLSAPPPT